MGRSVGPMRKQVACEKVTENNTSVVYSELTTTKGDCNKLTSLTKRLIVKCAKLKKFDY